MELYNAPRIADTDEGQQTVPKVQKDPGQEYRQGQGQVTPLPHCDFPMIIILLLWGALWPPQMPPL